MNLSFVERQVYSWWCYTPCISKIISGAESRESRDCECGHVQPCNYNGMNEVIWGKVSTSFCEKESYTYRRERVYNIRKKAIREIQRERICNGAAENIKKMKTMNDSTTSNKTHFIVISARFFEKERPAIIYILIFNPSVRKEKRESEIIMKKNCFGQGLYN